MKYLDKDGLSYFYSKVKGKIPTKVSDLTNDSGFTTNTGTITSVKMNGSTVSSSGEADLGTVITSHQNIKTINSTSLVGTGDVSVQPTLVSGTNIKTINNESLLGSGNITISGGGSATDVKINNTSITTNGVANIVAEGTYNSSTNKIATMAGASGLLAEEYDEGKTYYYCDIVTHNGKLYRLGDYNNVTGTWDSTKWSEITINDIFGDLIDIAEITGEDPVTISGLANWVYSTIYYESTAHLAPQYVSLETYNTGDVVVYDDIPYVCTTDNVTGSWNSNNWRQIYISDLFGDLNYIVQVTGNSPPTISDIVYYYENDILPYKAQTDVITYDYYSKSTYNVGEYVTHNGYLFRCNTQISSYEDWTPAHWTSVKLLDLINNKQDTLVSGTNIKTINNQSLLGSGNITISGGGGSATDVQINSTSITSNGVADLKAEGTYNASTNKLVTKNYVANQLVNYLPQDSNNGDYYLYVEPFIQGDTAQGLLMQAFSDTGSNDDIANIEMKAYYDSNDDANKASIYMYTQNGGSITLDENGTTITDIVTPTNNGDAVNKAYVDTIVGNINTLLSAI